MCRIAGIISKSSGVSDIRNKVSIMCDALKHGGPDDEGIFVNEEDHLVFGHRRLSIIDLSSHGHQPMADVDQKAWITFNGEIYNYLQLKSELIRAGARFYSNTDTEVILQAYLYWGTASFARLRGMFAFALYDKTKAQIYLVRDTAGIKPLYYHIKNGALSFASEVRALKAAEIATETDQNWPIKFLAYGHMPDPDTTLKDVFNLPKGHLLCWDINNCTYNLKSYSDKVATGFITDINQAKQTINNTLTATLKRQLIADAPIGVFLSGGIDSSLITLLANEEKQQQLKTVSIFFNEKEYDESAYQQHVSSYIKGEKFTHLVRHQDFDDCFASVINAMDMPTTDGINTWFISKYARQNGLKTVLSGIGADELFGGYPSFSRIKYIQHIRKLPPSALKAINLSAVDRYKRTAYLAYDHPLGDYLFLRGLFTPPDIAQILNCDEACVNNVLFSANYKVNPEFSFEERASHYETNLYMQNQLLRDTDVMSMNHGLEIRVPFLDEDFLQAVSSIAPAIRFNKTQPKKLLIDSFNNILPPSIWDRPKMGFSFPLQQWMRKHPEITDEKLYKNKITRNIINKFKNDRLHWSKAFAIYQIEKHA